MKTKHPLSLAKTMWRYQKYGSAKRGIDFNLTFEEWYNWFLYQGVDRNIPQQNKGESWAMCRKNDQGAYQLDNIYLATMKQNSSDAHLNKRISYRSGAAHPNSKRIQTPAGLFETRIAAIRHYKITAETMRRWLRDRPLEFFYP